MNTLQTENRIARDFEGLMEALMILVITLAPVYSIWSLGAFPVIAVA